MKGIIKAIHSDGSQTILDAYQFERIEATNFVVDLDGTYRNEINLPGVYTLILFWDYSTFGGFSKVRPPKVLSDVRSYEFIKAKDARNLMFAVVDGENFFWENYEGEIPQIGDKVINFPLDAEDSQSYRVVDRWTCNRQPDQVRYIVKKINEP